MTIYDDNSTYIRVCYKGSGHALCYNVGYYYGVNQANDHNSYHGMILYSPVCPDLILLTFVLDTYKDIAILIPVIFRMQARSGVKDILKHIQMEKT